MAKPKSPDEKKDEKQNSVNSIETSQEILNISQQLPDEAQQKLKELKAKLNKFKAAALKKFDKYIMAIALLPPKKAQEMIFNPGGQFGMPPGMPGPQGISQASATVAQPMVKPEEKQAPKNEIEVLVLVDDSDSKRMPKLELKEKLGVILNKLGKEVDNDINVEVKILSEIWQGCYDAKYEDLQLISISAPVYDTGMLAAIKIAEIHKTMVLKKFEKYIVSYVLAGSLIQGKATEKSDVDVFIVIDDTDVKRMTRFELKEKLRAIIIGMALDAGDLTGIKNKLNVQVYILTDFWESIKEANPIIFTFLRDGVPFYDRGIFMPWKQLLRMGRVKPSSEAIELYMSSGDQVLQRAKFKLKEIGMEDTFWAILTPSQAALMLYGVPPPTPKETPEVMRDIFVKKEKLLEEEYIKILEHNIEIRKKLEHGDLKEITGVEADKLLRDAERYLKRIEKLFKQIQKTKEEEGIVDMHNNLMAMAKDALKLEGVEKVSDLQLPALVDKHLVEKRKLSTTDLKTLKEVIKAKKDYELGKLSKAEMVKVAKDAQVLTRMLLELVQREKGIIIERSKIRVKYGQAQGEVFVLGKDVYIMMDTTKPEVVNKASVNSDGSITTPVKSSPKELEEAIANFKSREMLYIKPGFFQELRKLFGEEAEVSVGF